MMSRQSSTHSSQMKTVGPAMSLRTSCWLLPQNEQYKVFFESLPPILLISEPRGCIDPESAVPMSGSAISAFRHHMIERWHGALMRRSQRRRLTWTRMKTIADRYLPFPRILHPWPEKRFLVTIQGGSPVR